MRNFMISTPHPILFGRINSRRMRWAEHVVCIGERKDGVLVGKPEGKKPLGKPRRGWEDNIKMYLQKWYVMAWTGSVWLKIGTGGGYL
jgi:hypothetical protein